MATLSNHHAQHTRTSHLPPSSSTSTSLTLVQVPSRTRSLSGLSTHSTASSMSKIKIRLAASSKAPAAFARKLLSRNKPDLPADADGLVLDQTGNHTKDMTRRPSAPRAGAETPVSPLAPPDHTDDDDVPLRPVPGARGKVRSYSFPFPNSTFDVLPHVDCAHENIRPLPLLARDLFDEMLPRELQLRVFSALISLHEADHHRLKSTPKWSVLSACSPKNRWVARHRALRELVKLSRVSKLWRMLVFDGQLWQDVDIQTFPAASSGFLTPLLQLSGPFVQTIDLSGQAFLSPTALIDMAGSLCVRSAPVASVTYTQLTAITLQGCTSLTTQSLHSLLIRSPFLRSLNVKGLQAVTNATFDVLALCLHLSSLNMSRCVNIDGDGVRAFGAAVISRGARLALEELRLSGLGSVTDDTLATLGKAAPYLEVLDLSYCRSLHNSALEAFVSCAEDGTDAGETVLLSSRQAGRDPKDLRRYRRRVTALRHISLSECVMLTDTACSNLAHAVPRLELLELAGIGHTLNDDGLIRLLGTTPLIRKLDLEDACDLSDAVLGALTPIETNAESSPSPPRPGHALEHLTVSGATNLSNEAFKALIRGCPRLRVLEADNTSISGTVLKDFVKQACERGMSDAELVVVDCRSVRERAVKDVVDNTRPRKGWRAWEARKLGYLDGRDGENLEIGQDECDEKRVVIKSFYSWQTVDEVRQVREQRKKASKRASKKAQSASEQQLGEFEDGGRLFGRMKWWALSRTPSGGETPSEDDDRDGCVVM